MHIYVCVYIYIHIISVIIIIIIIIIHITVAIIMFTILDLRVSSLRRGHANLLCVVPILTDDPMISSLSNIKSSLSRLHWKWRNSYAQHGTDGSFSVMFFLGAAAFLGATDDSDGNPAGPIHIYIYMYIYVYIYIYIYRERERERERDRDMHICI